MRFYIYLFMCVERERLGLQGVKGEGGGSKRKEVTDQAFKEPLARRRAAGHYVPDFVFELGELEALLDFLWCHC